MKAIYYTTSDGHVTKAIEAIESMIEINKESNESYIEGELEGEPVDYKVIDGVLTKKEELPIIINGTTINNIPINTFVTVNLQPTIEVNDGILDLEATYNQVVTVYFYNKEYLSKTIKISV